MARDQMARTIHLRIPGAVDDEITEAAQKLGLKKSQVYRNLLYMALEDYRLLDKMGLFKAAAYFSGVKQRFRDQVGDEFDEYLPE